MTNKSPLRYPGGKTRACAILDNILGEHFDVTLFDAVISPFLGGGSFEFYLQNKYGLNIIANDKFTPLYHFWLQVKTNRADLCAELTKLNVVTKEDFTKYRTTILELDSEILKQATQYFIINRCSFSGATLSGGFSDEASKKRFTPSSIDRINNLDMSHIELSNLDFAEFINNTNNNRAIMFLDPPYYLEKKSKLYGNNGDLHEQFDHQLLFDKISTKKNWIMTYNNCEYIRKLYKDFKIVDASWSYGMNKSKQSSEIVILSV